MIHAVGRGAFSHRLLMLSFGRLVNTIVHRGARMGGGARMPATRAWASADTFQAEPSEVSGDSAFGEMVFRYLRELVLPMPLRGFTTTLLNHNSGVGYDLLCRFLLLLAQFGHSTLILLYCSLCVLVVF